MFYQPDPDDRTVHDFGFERNGHAACDGKPIRDRSPLPLSSSLSRGLRAVNWDEAAMPGAACFTRGNVRSIMGKR